VNLTRTINRAVRKYVMKALNLSPVDGNRGAWQVLESFPFAWQADVTVNQETVSAYWAVFSCLTLISSDIAKLPPRVMEYDEDEKIWKPTALRPVLRKPNNYQTTIDFLFSWIVCELRHGNTYVLKVRDSRTGFVTALHVLDPLRVEPLITPSGDVYYRLNGDDLAGLEQGQVVVPASEIIHDRMYPLFHPLVGVSPIFACGIAAMQGAAIMNNATAFFQNMSRPSGILTAPGEIADETATRLKAFWDENFKGANAGKVAVAGDGLKYEPMTITATDAQLIEQLKMTGEMVCACFRVPPYKLGLGQMPTVNNTASLNQQYYDQCLQFIIEKMESRLDEGLELDGTTQQVWLDTGPLLRMDPQTRATVLGQKVRDAILSPNEARREDDLPPVIGGDSPMIQEQNYSLEAIAKRDANNPFAPPAPAAPAAPEPEPVDAEKQARMFRALVSLELA
jgi:HK97 family phage portal protein